MKAFLDIVKACATALLVVWAGVAVIAILAGPQIALAQDDDQYTPNARLMVFRGQAVVCSKVPETEDHLSNGVWQVTCMPVDPRYMRTCIESEKRLDCSGPQGENRGAAFHPASITMKPRS